MLITFQLMISAKKNNIVNWNYIKNTTIYQSSNEIKWLVDFRKESLLLASTNTRKFLCRATLLDGALLFAELFVLWAPKRLYVRISSKIIDAGRRAANRLVDLSMNQHQRWQILRKKNSCVI